MNPIIRFLLVAGATASVVVIVSLLWPRLTSQPRPEVLQAVQETALTTGVGQEAAKVLGVEEEKNVKPVNLSSAAASVAGGISSTIAQKAQEIVTQQITNQIISHYTQLPQSQQQQVQEFICKPK